MTSWKSSVLCCHSQVVTGTHCIICKLYLSKLCCQKPQKSHCVTVHLVGKEDINTILMCLSYYTANLVKRISTKKLTCSGVTESLDLYQGT